MKLRRGRTRNILEGSIDSALLAVEIYNKPRTTFRSEGYISLMVIAWTKLLHAYFHRTIGDKYYYRTSSGRYQKVDGERKAWELKTCVREYDKLNNAEPLDTSIVSNLLFFVGLRNKIEHRHVAKSEIDALIFGECQALLYNYESMLIKFFGEEYVLNENLVYSLQFSEMRTEEQRAAGKNILAREVREIREYIEKYRSSLPDEVFESQRYSIKLIQVPRVANTNRNDVAIEFVRWSELDEDDKAKYEELVTLIKEKVVRKEAANVGKLKPGDVIKQVKERLGIDFHQHHHKCFYNVFSVRPVASENRDPFDTNTLYCHYDEAHNDYVYREAWVDCIVSLLNAGKVDLEQMKGCYREKRKLSLDTLEPVNP